MKTKGKHINPDVRSKGQVGSVHENQPAEEIMSHPLFPVFVACIEQAMYGKGERHGGCSVPFLTQPWVHYADMHGRGFLTGQAAKKLEEAASVKQDYDFEQEVRGAIVYCGMSLLYESLNSKGEL